MAKCNVRQFANVSKMHQDDNRCPAWCGPRINQPDAQVQSVIDSFSSKSPSGNAVPLFTEGGELDLPRGLVPTWTESGGSYRPLDVPPPNYRSYVTTAPPNVRQMTAVIPKTGFMVICDDVELAGNEALEAPEVPTTVELDARWDEKDGFILKIFRKADSGTRGSSNRNDQFTGNILRREIGARKLAYLKYLESQKRVRTRRIKEYFYVKDEVTEDGGSDEGSSETEEFKMEDEIGDVMVPEAFLAVRIPLLQKPAPVVPLHFVLEHLKNRDRGGWKSEEIDSIVQRRLAALGRTRSTLTALMQKTRAVNEDVKLSPQAFQRFAMLARILSKLQVLSNYIIAQGEIMKEKISWEARVGALFPPGLPIVDACIGHRFKDHSDYDYDMEIELEPLPPCPLF